MSVAAFPRTRSEPSPDRSPEPAPAMVLHRFGPYFGAPDSSPFVIKAMVLLKMAGLSYRDVPGNPLRAPRKLLPVLEDDGEVIADSGRIRAHLERKYALDFDEGLSQVQRARSWAVERMCEDHLYFAMLADRWRDPEVFRRGVGTMFGMVPAPVRPVARTMLRRANLQRLHGHGLGRHSPEEISALAARDIESLACLLGDQPNLMGNAPCAADAAVFGIVVSILTPPADSPLRAAMAARPNLVAYRDRMMGRFFPPI